MTEIVVNLHIHSTYSDGHGTHAELAQAAMKAGLDAILVTDHNVFVDDIDGYFRDGRQRVLVLVCEEVHNPRRDPPERATCWFWEPGVNWHSMRKIPRN